MSNASDFIIENGVLTKYVGPGGDVVIPDGVKAIGDRAFDFCDNLISVRIPDGVAAIGNCAFHCCFKLTNVSIPDSVTAIGDEAFAGCHSLVSVNIPDNAISIGYNAFGYCRSLTAVTIPNSVISINEDAFRGCKNLVSVTISNNVAAIGNWAFHECAQLTKVVLPTSLGSCVTKVFDFNDKLRIETPDLSALPAKYRICAALCFAEDGGSTTDPRFESHGKYLKANSGKLVEAAAGNLDLLALLCREVWIKAKDIEAFVAAVQKTGDAQKIAMILDYQSNKLTTKQKENVEDQREKQKKTVFDRAVARMNQVGIAGLSFVVTGDVKTFENRKELKMFIESQGAKLQSSMSAKTDYLIMNDATSDTEKRKQAEELGVDIITELQFNDKAGRQFVIRENGTLVGYRGAGGDVVIPDRVTAIDNRAFSYCSGLTSITIPDSVSSIGESAFRGCSGLADDSGFVIIRGALHDYVGSASDVTIPDGVTTICERVFYNYSNMTSVTIPSSVTKIGSEAFYRCSGLTSVTIPDGVTAINYNTFCECSRLAAVTIPSSVTKIGSEAFLRCSGLTSVTIPDGVTSILRWAFLHCEGLVSVSLPNSVTDIGEDAFYGCESLTIHAPESSYAKKYAKENNIPFVAE